MTIILYNSTTEQNTLDKTSYLTQVVSLTGTLRSGTNVIDPEVVIELATLPNFNYVYIPDFNRYYFVRDIYNINNKLWNIKCHVDVLYSYKNSILNLNVEVNRNEYDYDLLLNDTLRDMDSNYGLQILESNGAELYYDIPHTYDGNTAIRWGIVCLGE